MEKRWNLQELTWLVENYPRVGKKESMRILNRSEGSIRSKTAELKLISIFKDTNPESNYKKGSYFRGKKRPEHSALQKQRKFVPANYFTDKTRLQMS